MCRTRCWRTWTASRSSAGRAARCGGANAVNGVINVITKSAKETQGTLVTGGGGWETRGFGAVRYGTTLGTNLFFRAYAKYRDMDSTRRATGNQAVNDWRLGQGGFRTDWEPSDTHQLTLQGDYYSGSVDQGALRPIALEGANVLGRWVRMFSEESNVKVQLYYDRTRRLIPGTFSEHLDTYDFDLQHRFPVGDRNTLLWGAGYRLIDDDVGNTAALAFLPAQVTRQLFSGFIQDEIKLVPDQLQLTLGTKLEHNDYTGIEVQPSARLAWTPTGEQTVWAAVSRAVRVPSRIDREFFLPSSGAVIAGGPNFVSEELLAYEVGCRVRPHQRVSLSASLFFNDYDNLRTVEPAAPPAALPTVLVNGLRGETYGAELAAEYRVTDWWRLRASFTELQIHLRPKPGSLDTTNGGSESRDPNHQFSLRSSFDLPGRFELDAGLRHVSRLPSQNVPAYTELDARLGWKASRNVEFSLVGQNLLHPHHAEFGAPATRNLIERAIFGKVTCRF
jgi:iron complex outermembrane recepter protein